MKNHKHTSTRSSNLREALSSPDRERLQDPPEALPHGLPIWIEKELVSGLTRSDIESRILYSKERSTFYLREFNRPDIREVERDFFQECCQYHTARVIIWEIALERLRGRIL